MKALLSLFLIAAIPAAAQETTSGGVIVPPARRAQSLERAEGILQRSPGSLAETLASVPDPFHAPKRTGDAGPADPLAPLSDAKILAAATAKLTVNGILGSGARRSVQIGRELYRVGAEVPVDLSGRSVSLRIVEIGIRSVVFGYNAETLEIRIR